MDDYGTGLVPDPRVKPAEVDRHLRACIPCQGLLRWAKNRGTPEALAFWRRAFWPCYAKDMKARRSSIRESLM